MKDKYSIFILVLTLIIVWFVSKGLLSYWENQVESYYHTTLSDICAKYDGESRFTSYVFTNREGKEIDKVAFRCDFLR